MILAGRRINDGMAVYVANDVIKTMLKRKQGIDIGTMGFTFKESVPDTRNTKSCGPSSNIARFCVRDRRLRSYRRR